MILIAKLPTSLPNFNIIKANGFTKIEVHNPSYPPDVILKLSHFGNFSTLTLFFS